MAQGIYYLVEDVTEQCACSHFGELIITLYVNTCIGEKNWLQTTPGYFWFRYLGELKFTKYFSTLGTVLDTLRV